MTNVVKLDSQAHRELRVRGGPSAGFGDAQRFAAVTPGEFTQMATCCPLFFSKDAETGAFYCGAMFGFDDGENLFLDGDVWQGHRPLSLQRMPFYTAGPDLVVDLDHPRVGLGAGGDGAAVFDAEGRPTAYLESVVAALRQLRAGEEQARIFIETLLKHDLIEAVELDIAFDDGAHHHIRGLYTVDRERLESLADEVVVELFRRGYLLLIDAMLVSQKQLPALIERRNARKLAESAGLRF
jgi:hypothetical protein